MSTLSDPDEPECMEEVNISNQDGSRVEDDVQIVGENCFLVGKVWILIEQIR